ncbi:MAG: hypothetical protein N3F06_00140, partial [Nitrososphaerales archaeon]|nr:hypothetical protein [Nitrososphaerales archaeon]
RQGIDYDFKTIATQVSPIDSLIQRLGRCARKSDGTALLFKDLEGAKCVYPQIVIDETIKILNEDDLAESVKNISTASKLVNAVYREDVVRELRGEIDRELSEALSFIKTFSTDSAKIFVARNLFKIPNLLRLGIEVKCILLPQEIYQRIMESLRSGSEKSTFEIPLTQAIDLLHRNTLSLSVERLYRGYEIPALSHRIDGEEFYLSLSIEYKTDLKNQASEPKVDLNIVKYRRLSDCYREGFIHPFIINPLYYIVERDFHLGLVKPYG